MRQFYLIAGLALFAALSSPLAATAAISSGSCGDNATWELDGNTLKIKGSGAMTNYISPYSAYATYPEWNESKDLIEHVVIEQGITTVGDFAFYDYPNIESVALPEGLKHLGNYTFAKCFKLSNVVLPSTLQSIGEKQLNYNYRGYTFAECHSIKEITLPQTLTFLGGCSFNDCNALTKVTWNAIDCEADSFDPVARYIGNFKKSPVYTVVFGPGVKSVPARAFKDVPSLSIVKTPGTIEFVGYQAFDGTYWENNQDIEKLVYIDKVAYLYHVDEYLHTPLDITIADGTKTITDYIFASTRLSSISVPESVTRIGNKSFKSCDSLVSVNWNAISIETYKDYEGKKMFGDSLKTIVFGNKVSMLPEEFLCDCRGIKELTLPTSLKTIGKEAFAGCSGISELVIPDGVETLGKLSISRMTSLERITIGEGLKEFDYYYFLSGCPKLSTLTWNAIRTAQKDFDAYHGTDVCSAPIESFIVGNKVEYIPGQLFWKSQTLKNVTLGEAVTEIGEAAFRECKNLKTIELPESLKKIDSNAFYNSGLTKIVVPRNVTEIGTWGLGTASLTMAVLAPFEVPVSASAFINYNKELKIYVPDVDVYSDSKSPFAQYRNMLEPMAVADCSEFEHGATNLPVTFTCNIPGYSMTVTDMPTLENTPGKHSTAVEALFKGDENFSAKFAYNYTVKEASGIENVAEAAETSDIYTSNGILLYRGAEAGILQGLPKGIYIIKQGERVTKIVR